MSGSQELPVGLDPRYHPEEGRRSALRLLSLSITGHGDNTATVRVTSQSWSRERPRDVVLYTTDGDLGTVGEMVQALHTAAEELRLRYQEERAIV